MSRLRKLVQDSKKNASGYKFQDDRSGFIHKSSEMVIDHRGRVLTAQTLDPVHPTEIPLDIPADYSKLPIMRPRIEGPDVSAAGTRTWSNIEWLWHLIDIPWSEL